MDNISNFIRTSTIDSFKSNSYVAPTTANDQKSSSVRSSPSSSSQTYFPERLHDMLKFAQENELQHVISWTWDGKAFIVHDINILVSMLPRFFGQTKYRSFERQLNMWSFERIILDHTTKKLKAFYHPYFVRGQKLLCRFVTRNMFKKAAEGKRNKEFTAGSLVVSRRSIATRMTKNSKSTTKRPEDKNQSSIANMTLDSVTNTKKRNNDDMNIDLIGNSTFSATSEITLSNVVTDLLLSSPNNGCSILAANFLGSTTPDESSKNLKDGDLTTFEGRQFFFVDCSISEF